MRTTNFDAIAAAAPLDRQASVVRDGSGDLWSGKVKPTTRHWDAPPPPEAARPDHVEDFAGRQVHRLTVVRYHGKRKGGGHWFLVRCACGDYELRRDKFLRDPPMREGQQEHACEACDYLAHIKWIARNAGSGRLRVANDAAFLDQLAASQRTA